MAFKNAVPGVVVGGDWPARPGTSHGMDTHCLLGGCCRPGLGWPPSRALVDCSMSCYGRLAYARQSRGVCVGR